MLVPSSAALAADEICSKVRAFHQSSFDESVNPTGRRWVEMHWRGHWMDFDKGFGRECRSSQDHASRRFCGWLSKNTSTEFATRLPIRILTCFGYRFPPHSDWSGWKSDVSLLSDDRWLLLEIDFVSFQNDTGAVRLSSFAKDEDEATVEMPALSESAN